MTAAELIREFQQLPETEQQTVLEFVDAFRKRRQLSPEELQRLAERMTEVNDRAQKDELKERIINGFYGR